VAPNRPVTELSQAKRPPKSRSRNPGNAGLPKLKTSQLGGTGRGQAAQLRPVRSQSAPVGSGTLPVPLPQRGATLPRQGPADDLDVHGAGCRLGLFGIVAGNAKASLANLFGFADDAIQQSPVEEPEGLGALVGTGMSPISPSGGMHSEPTRWEGLISRVRPTDPPEFHRQLTEALNLLASRPVGRALLEGIAEAKRPGADFGYKVCLRPAAWTVDKAGQPVYVGTCVTRSSSDSKASQGGGGAVSSVSWNPVQHDTPHGRRPPFIALAHELIHAYRNLLGRSVLVNADMLVDEHAVIGLDGKDTEITENKIRAEHGLDLRETYDLDDGEGAPVAA
jgi:hypothetical protein